MTAVEIHPFVAWAHIRQILFGIEALIIIFSALERQVMLPGMAGVKLKFRNFMFGPDEPVCGDGKDENAPACAEPDCQGDDKDEKCTAFPNKTCYPIIALPERPYQEWGEESFNEQQQMLLLAMPSRPRDGKMNCHGLGFVPYTTNEAGEKAVNEFCGTTSIFGKNKECKDFFNRILTECDGSDMLNPQNLKHGGFMSHPRGAQLAINPQKGANPRCNGPQRKKWIDRDQGANKIAQFCKETPLDRHRGDRLSAVYDQGRNTELSILALWTEDIAMSEGDCNHDLLTALDGCDQPGPTTNPRNTKFGGSYTNSHGVLWVLTPNVIPPVFPPDAIAPDGSRIDPKCTDRGGLVMKDWLGKAAEAYCIEGHQLYDYDYHFNWRDKQDAFISMSAELIPDEDPVYKQGKPICRATKDWHPGKMRRTDCKEAFGMMNSLDCDRGGSFIYNCVTWKYEQHYTGWQKGDACGPPKVPKYHPPGESDTCVGVEVDEPQKVHGGGGMIQGSSSPNTSHGGVPTTGEYHQGKKHEGGIN